MNFNDLVIKASEYQTMIGIDSKGNIELINHSNPGRKHDIELRSPRGCIDLLWDMFNQHTQINFFDESFKKEFCELVNKHSKRMCINETTPIS